MLNLRCPWGSSIYCSTSGQIHDVFWHQILSPIKSWKSRVGRARTVCNNSELEACKVFLFLSHLNCFQHSESTWCSRADWELTLNFHHRPHLMFTSNAHGLVIWTEHYFHLPSPIAALSRVDSSELDDFFFFSWSWWISCARFVVHTRGAFRSIVSVCVKNWSVGVSEWSRERREKRGKIVREEIFLVFHDASSFFHDFHSLSHSHSRVSSLPRALDAIFFFLFSLLSAFVFICKHSM